VRLEPLPGERIDRAREIAFDFDGRKVVGFAGDTIASALYASGTRVFSRSFKYHRPRGLLCCEGHCPNCMMTVDGVPNVRVCVEPLRAGVHVLGQNVRGSLERDLMAIIDKIGGPLTPVGFYYRTMIRPRRAWPVYERILRSCAGLGRVGGATRRRYDTEHRVVDVLVVGGGEAGRLAAAEAANSGASVIIVDDGYAFEGLGYEVLAPARALAIYEGGLVPVDAGDVLYRIHASKIVVATGSIDQPLVFPGNDLIGVMLPSGVRRLVNDWAVSPGTRAVVVGDEAIAADLKRAGVELAASAGRATQITAHGRGGRLQSVVLDGQRIRCDLLVASGLTQSSYSLLAQAGSTVRFDPNAGVFMPVVVPDGVTAVGSVSLAQAQEPVPASYHGGGKRFVCLCEDVTVKDMKRAVREGFDSIELAKRYTTATMGPCQGKLCHLNSVRLLAEELGRREEEIGTTTARPPWAPVELGLLAGRHLEPVKSSSLTRRHMAAGANMMWTGPWRRPHSYGDPAVEVRAVHERVGVIDVSTLGKIVVEGPGAAALLDRLYPNRIVDLKPNRVRYGVLTTDGGRIFDDGTLARLDDETFYVTTTSTGASVVAEWFEWWNTTWGYDAQVVNLTGALAAVNVAGPHARDVLEPLTERDISSEAFRYLDAHELRLAGVPCLAMRIGFVGELGYELHCPASVAQHLWDAVVAAGAVPFGLEAQRVLRLEKAHVIIGQDTDSESNILSAGMPWMVKAKKKDFVGSRALPHTRVSERLVGFIAGVLPPEGAQVVREDKIAGRVTSARFSERLGHPVGLCWVQPDDAVEGAEIMIRFAGHAHPATVTLSPFYDAEGARVRS
jgi:sarcosine oxidase, subunit alpha